MDSEKIYDIWYLINTAHESVNHSTQVNFPHEKNIKYNVNHCDAAI